MNIAIFLPNWLGDLVMATPMLRAMRRHFGAEARLIGVLRPHLAEVLAGTDWLDEQWLFNPRAKRREWRHWALIHRMRQRRVDMALLLPNSFRVAVLARLGGSRERIGYSRYGRGPLLTRRVCSPRRSGHLADAPMVDYYLKLAEAVGCPPESRRLELVTSEEDERSADRVWQHLGLRADRQVIALNSGSANGAARCWPTEHFASLAHMVAEQLDHDVLVFCGPKERPLAQEIVRLANHPRVFSMADQPLDLGTAKACIRRARLMVSTDSGPRHVAAAFGKPVITLYGPTLPVWSENPTVVAIGLRLDLPCIGCQNRVCPLGHNRCMKDLTPEMVYAAVERLLKKQRAACAA
jgi:heptosyltransferase-2